MDEAAKRVNTVLDEYQKKREDFKLDAAIKIGGGATVGLTFGILTKRLIKIRRSVVAGSFIGLGMAVERYSQQLRYLASAICLQKTGIETGFLAQNLDRLLDRDFRAELKTG
jgi:hypothetical protein